MKTKLWKLNIEACGINQAEAAKQMRKLLDDMLVGKHTRGYT